jgi:hypothetical protein
MKLADFLTQKRSLIIEKWCDVVLQAYPEQGRSFLRKQKNQFANPVGRTIFEGIESIYDELLGDANSDKLSLFLDNIVRVRAVQEFAPSKAVGFIFGLKTIIRDELGAKILQSDISEEWAAFERRIDGLALLCFDVYSECRQKISDIRVKELRNQSHRLLKMAGLAYELPEDYERPSKGGKAQGENSNNG